MKRIQNIDTVRGFVMVLMALDHVREFIHVSASTQSPTDLQTTTTALFFTRWITHLCAPVFVFLSGISAFLLFTAYQNTGRGRKFFLTRGLWLIFLEFTIVNFALWFDVEFRLIIMEVIAAIGFGFIILSLLIHMSYRITGILGLLLIVTHNLLQGIQFSDPVANFIFSVFFRPGLFTVSPAFSFLVSYPVLPWTGILLIGFSMGRLFLLPDSRRIKLFFYSGSVALVLFIAIRITNYYGDPSPWSAQKSGFFTFLSFINVTKYPPSLLFTLLFLGIALFILGFSESVQGKISKVLSVYGRVPLFYFIVHLYLIHGLMFAILYIQGYTYSDFKFGAMLNGRPPSGGGLSLTWVYLIWSLVVIILYPACKWYADYKNRHPEKKILKYI